MKSMKKSILMISLVLGGAGVFAQHDHSNHGGGGHGTEMERPPHGGEINKVGKFQIEMVVNAMFKENQLNFYLLKSNLKPIANEGITGTIVIDYDDGVTSTQNLKAVGDDFFVAQMDKSVPFRCKVEFLVKGKIVSTFFTYKGFSNNMASVYSCSMHPEIKSDNPGKCPKCGMTLEKQ